MYLLFNYIWPNVPVSWSFQEKKTTSSFLSHFYHFNPICSSLMSFPCRLVLFTLLQTAFQNTLSISSFLIPTFTVTDPHIWHRLTSTVWLTPGLPASTLSSWVSAQLHWQWQLARASSLKWQRQHVNRHAKLETRGKAQTTVIWICAAEGFKADESSCTLKPEVFRVKATAQEYAHQHSTGGPKSHERQNKRNY